MKIDKAKVSLRSEKHVPNQITFENMNNNNLTNQCLSELFDSSLN